MSVRHGPSGIRWHSRPIASGALTPMTEGEARLHLALAYQATFGDEPRQAVLSVLLAQWALETARGKRMFGYNFGGLTSQRRGARLHTREFYGSRQVSGPRRFRVYETAIAGAVDYVQTLAQAFPKSFDALHDGGAIAFVRALSEEDYFTGNPVHYQSAVVSLTREFDRKAFSVL